MGAVTWRGIRQHPVRFILSVLAVVLGIAFVSGTFSLRTVLDNTFTDVISTSAGADAYVRPEGTAKPEGPSAAGVQLSLAQTIGTAAGVDTVAPTLEGPIVLVGMNGAPVASGGLQSVGYGPLNPRQGSIVQGTMPQANSEIALEEDTAERAGLKVGSKTQIVIGSDVRSVTIVGIARLDNATAGQTIVFIDYDSALKAFAPDGLVPSIAVYGKPGVSQQQLANSVASVLTAGSNTEVAPGSYVRDEAAKKVNSVLGFVTAFLLVFAFIALIVGGFVIANTFAMVVRHRTREIAILRALGASPGQVMRSVLLQAALVGLLGSVVGILAGVALVALVRAALSALNMSLSSAVPLDPVGVIVGLLVGVATAVLAAIWPARAAATIPPVEALQENAAERRDYGWQRAAIGAVLLIAGMAVIWYCLTLPTGAGYFLIGAAVLIIAGAVLIAPIVAKPFVSVLALLPVAAIPPLGKLARGNVTRQPRRTANTAGALMIGMALVASASVLASSTHASVAGVVQRDVKADYILESQAWLFQKAAIDKLQSLSTVGLVEQLRTSRMKVDVKDSTVYADTDTLLTKSLDVPVVQGKISTLSPGQAIVTQAYATAHNAKVGTVLQIEPNTPGHAQAPNPEQVVGVIESSTLGNAVLIAGDDFDKNVSADQQRTTMVLVTGKPGVDKTTLRRDITNAVQPYYTVTVLDKTEYTNELSSQVNNILILIYALLALSLLIAFLGIVNTLALSIVERTREIGLMRAVGLGRAQQAGIVVIEAILIAVFGTIVGLAIGVGLAAVLQKVFAGSGLAVLSIPWWQLALTVVIAIVLAGLAALGPALKAARLPVLQAINYD